MAKYRRQKRVKHKKRIKKYADDLSNPYVFRRKTRKKKEVFLAATILLTLAAVPSSKQLIMPKRLLQN